MRSHELVQTVAVALLEGRALRLAVVGQHDDLVRTRRVLARPGDAAELLIDLAQHLHGVGALQPGVVGDLVVAGEARVHGRDALHHVADDAEDGEVAHHDGQPGAHEPVLDRARAARLHVAAARLDRRHALDDELVDEQHEGARDVVAVGEVGAVARVRLLLRLHAADGEDHVVGVAGQKVAAAGAAVRQQAVAARVAFLEQRAVGRRGAGHDPAGLLLDPPEGRDVVVGPEQQPRLGGACLRRQIGLPLVEMMGSAGDPARHLGRVPVAHGALQHRPGQPVYLQIDDAGHVGDDALTRDARDALRHTQCVDVVVVRAEHDLDGDGDGRRDERDEERRHKRVDRERRVAQVGGGHDHQGVQHEDEQEAEGEHVRQAQGGDERRQEGVEHRDEDGRQEGAERALDGDARHDQGRDVEGRGARGPLQQQTEGPQLGPSRPPLRPYAVPLPVHVKHPDLSSFQS